MLAGFIGWLIKVASGDLVAKVVDALGRSDAGRAKLEEVKARTAEALATESGQTDRELITALNARQASKINQPVFWIIIGVMIGPPALILWGVAIYNILWWQHGIWPQAWAIADFPSSIKPWVELSIHWLYDPLGAPSSVGAAAVAGWLTGKR